MFVGCSSINTLVFLEIRKSHALQRTLIGVCHKEDVFYFIPKWNQIPSSSGVGQGDLLMIQLWLAFIPLEAGIFYPRWECDYTQVGFPLARPVCICSAAGPIFLFSSSSWQVCRKELAGDEDAQNFPYWPLFWAYRRPMGKCLCLREKTEVTFKT